MGLFFIQLKRRVRAAYKMLGTVIGYSQLPELVNMELTEFSGRHNFFSGADPNARNPKDGLIAPLADNHGNKMRVSQSTTSFRINVQTEVGTLVIQYFLSIKAITPQHPVGLIKPIFPAQGRL